MTWCPFPFRSVMVKTDGHLTTCCYGKNIPGIHRDTHTIEQAFNSPEFQQIRNNLSNGIQDSNCEKCWQLEKLGAESLRQQEIRTEEYPADITENPRIEYLFLSLSNQCNLKCRTCSPTDSSFWIKEYEQTQGVKQLIYLEPDDSKFFSSFKNDTLPHLKEIAFTGGEPLMMKSVHRILETLDPSVSLTFYTNGTFYNSEILDRFRDVNIAVSIDGIGSRFEYMRHPAKWNDVFKNLYRMNGHLKAITCTVSAYNVFYINEVAEFAKSLDVDFMTHFLFEPQHLSVLNIPKEVRPAIIDKLSKSNHPQIDKVIDYLKSDIEYSWDNFVKEVKLRDEYRGESFDSTFTEYNSVLRNYGKAI